MSSYRIDAQASLCELVEVEPFGVRYKPRGITRVIHRALPPWGGVDCVQVNEGAHSFEMLRDQHHFILYRAGSVSDGEASVNGHRVAGARALDQVVDFVPGDAQFSGWVGERAKIGYMMVSINDELLLQASSSYRAPKDLSPLISCRDPFLLCLLQRLGEVVCSGAIDSLYLETLVMLMMQEVRNIQRLAEGASIDQQEFDPRLRQKLMLFIEMSLASDLRLVDLSNVVNLSPSHFSRVFRRSFGMSAYQYLIRCRVEKAKELIATTDRSLLEIAMDTGFSGASQFSRTFHRIVGVAPSKLSRAGALKSLKIKSETSK